MSADGSPHTLTRRSLLELRPGARRALRLVVFFGAVLVLIVGVFARQLGWFDYRPGGAAFFGPIRMIFLGLFALSTLIALRFELIGGTLAGFSAGTLVAFALNQLEVTDALTVLIAISVPAVGWVLLELTEQPRRRAIAGLAVAAALSGSGLALGHYLYDLLWGPTHPQLDLADDPTGPVMWIWSGAVTADEARVIAKTERPTDRVRLAIGTSSTLDDPRWLDPADTDGRIVYFDLTDLQPMTTYHYGLEVDSRLVDDGFGKLTTFPDGQGSFRVAVGSCARVGSNGRVFETIAATKPLLFLITGDFHYGDIPDDDVDRFRDVLDLTLSLPAQSALYRSVPIAYIWDDHDYGANDSDAGSPSRRAAMTAYRTYVPSYELAGPTSPIYQAFTIGRVRFIMTDARSGRVLGKGMLGPEQRAWFEDELVRSAADHELVIWVNPVPWIAPARAGADHWGGFPEEREAIANVIAEHDIDNLMMVSGDAHMVAVDDGTNSDYATDGGAGFPVLHAAALDRPGSVKGGPYSEGAIPGGGQFATIDIHDDGTYLRVELTGRNWRGERLLHHEFAP